MMTVHDLIPRITRLAVVSLSVLIPCSAARGGDAPEMRFMPIRQAPLGSPAGTIGDPVASQFNADRGCWEVVTSPGVEIDLELQAFGWGSAIGNPALGAVQGTLAESSLDNGTGTNLNPKGWPDSPLDGVYQPKSVCGAGGDGSPCVPPFDSTCANETNGICIPSPDWVMPQCASAVNAIVTLNLGTYAWATAAIKVCAFDDGQVKAFGGLILEVPASARGTYTISFDADLNNSFMNKGDGVHLPGLVLTSACITIPCQSDEDCDDGLDCTTDQCNLVTSACEAVVLPGNCAIDDQCIAPESEDPTDSCRFCDPAQSTTSWTPRPQDTPCGDPTDTTCNGPDTCNRNGVCLDRVQPDETPCEADANECTDDVCSAGTCAHPFSSPGTTCGDQNETPCDGADACDANGNCLDNVLPDATPCLNGTFCDGAELCVGGVCQPGEAPCDPDTQRCDEEGDRCNTLGDFDGNREVTLSDYLHWPDCETGPIGGPYPAGCEPFDFELNGLVDLRDHARFQQVFDGP